MRLRAQQNNKIKHNVKSTLSQNHPLKQQQHQTTHSLYPDLLPLYHPYELSDFPDSIWPYYTFAKNHPYLPYVTVTLYVFTIFYLQKLMEKRKAFDLRGPLIVWNLGLSVFSLIGFMRTAPMLYHNIFVQVSNNNGRGAEPFE